LSIKVQDGPLTSRLQHIVIERAFAEPCCRVKQLL